MDQYKLRLGDGTIVAVDREGLRTWMLDEKAMVQTPGSLRWRPLKQLLMEEPAAKPERAESPRPATPVVPAPRPLVLTSLADAIHEELSVRRASVPSDARPADDGLPIIPFKPLDSAGPQSVGGGGAAHSSRATTAADEHSLRDIAAAEIERHGTDGSWQWTAKGPRTVAAVDPPNAGPRSPGSTASEDQRPARTPTPAHVPPAMPAVVDRGFRAMFSGIDALVGRARQAMATRSSGGPAAASVDVQRTETPPEAVVPSSPLSELPTPPIPALPSPTPPTPTDTIGAEPVVAETKVGRPVPLRPLGAMLAAGAVAALLVAAFAMSRSTSGPAGGAGRPEAKAAPAIPPTLAPVPAPPPLPKDVQVAIQQLPHLSLETIQLVISGGGVRSSDPPELFRRAHAAEHRGASSLAPPEAQELRALKRGILSGLRTRERQRVQAYDRMSPERDLLVDEDAKVMALFTRGVRALSPSRQERLQELYGKAVAADLAPRVVAEARP